MERVLSLEDRIKKAEEIYYRRQNKVVNPKIISKNEQSNFKQKLIKKITLQTLISACIFTSFFIMLNNNTYSEIIKNKTIEILSYNIDFRHLYEKVINIRKEPKDEINNQEQIEETLSVEESIEEPVMLEETSSISQMQEDATYIKQHISFIKPLTGTITSRYGLRENVEPLYHTGIDIAANTGTIIVSAIEGTAEVVSTEGAYGKHIKITNGEISVLYAHCDKLYINQGDYINQGQQIAEVGSTGNATGPHLHFEIIRNGRYIDPDLILEF